MPLTLALNHHCGADNSPYDHLSCDQECGGHQCTPPSKCFGPPQDNACLEQWGACSKEVEEINKKIDHYNSTCGKPRNTQSNNPPLKNSSPTTGQSGGQSKTDNISGRERFEFEKAEKDGSPQALKKFLEDHPTGDNADWAKKRLKELGGDDSNKPVQSDLQRRQENANKKADGADAINQQHQQKADGFNGEVNRQIQQREADKQREAAKARERQRQAERAQNCQNTGRVSRRGHPLVCCGSQQACERECFQTSSGDCGDACAGTLGGIGQNCFER